MKKTIFLMFTLICALPQLSFAKCATKSLYAIVTPMPSESQYIRSMIHNKTWIKRSGLQYLCGTIHGKNVISLVTGYGKVNVIAATSRMLADFHPKAIILSETSGAVNKKLPIGAVIIGTKVFDADFGKLTKKGPSLPILITNPINHKKEPFLYPANQQLLAATKKSHHYKFPVIYGVIGDSDNLPNANWQLKLLRDNHVQAVAMDGAPVAKLCWLFNYPCIVLHGVANVAGKPITQANTDIAAKNSGIITVKLLSSLS
jgi:adenosylhomocysteine nucleosidase